MWAQIKSTRASAFGRPGAVREGMNMTRVVRLSLAVAVVLCPRASVPAQQIADPEFNTKVDRPAYTDRHPTVLIDEAHNNFHTAGGRYKPFADLIASDGYAVTPNRKKLSAEALKGSDVLVIVNAQGAPLMRSPEAANPAFEPAECDAIRDWVQAGGALLLIADHHPWGASNERLATRLGIDVGKSTTFDPVNSESGTLGLLNFSRENGLIGNHPILAGRDGSERVDRVLTFAGQSLKGPEGSISLLKLSGTAVDQSRPAAPGRSGPANGRSQGLAFALGKGRVVALGEAAMLTAQLNGKKGGPMGMNVPGTDNRQLALNIMHWLSGLKPTASGAGAAVASSAKPASPTTAAPKADPGRPLSSADIAAESEQSIALIAGDGSNGTGFIVRPGVLITNAHVIDSSFVSELRVRFPSAEKPNQGPIPAELIYEDTRRDLAFLRVKSPLPPLRVATSYTFRKGEDVTVIGNPGAGEELILENAISRGVMSTRTTIEGMRYYQLGIAVNPGNSGGPVFDSYGRVIGVVSRKSGAQEALAFSIPLEDVNLAIEKAVTYPQDAVDRARSQHRLVLAVKQLGAGGALYSVGSVIHRRVPLGGAGAKAAGSYYDSAVARLEKQTLPKLRAEVDRVRDDPLVDRAVREKVSQLAANLDQLKSLYRDNKPDQERNDRFSGLKDTHKKLLTDVCKSLAIEVPESLLLALDASTGRPRPPGATGAGKPIPQDTARMEKRPRDTLEWNRRTLQVAYDKVGKKDARWDKPAREALDLAARMFSRQLEPLVTLRDIHVPAKKAVGAGCNDPLILYLYARTSVGPNFPSPEEYARRIQSAADAMSASAYSPYRRAVAVLLASEVKANKNILSPEERRGVEQGFDAVLALLPKSAAEDPRNEDWEDGWYDNINSVIVGYRKLDGDYKAAFDRVDAELAKVTAIEALRLTVKGNFYINWGWEARTNATADKVNEEQFRTFETRLREARAALEGAWKAKPEEPNVADLMLTIEKGIGGGDREAMETWFERAMKADGNDREACWQKLDWLDPKWYGGETADEMIAFGRACRATNNWRAGITLLAAEAHSRYHAMLEPAEGVKYMRSAEVWSDIKSVFDEYLKHLPADHAERSKYAALCYFGAHYPEAHAQFQILGDRLTACPTYPYAPLESLKKMRDDTARIVAGKPRGGDAPAPKSKAAAKPSR
jgi:S1-C subfamily serine protease